MPDDLDDERFDAAWKRASNETPPAALDDAIRAAARREVGARPQDVARVPEATRPERWWFPLAAAAMIGAVAIGLLQLSSPERVAPRDEQHVVSDIPPGVGGSAPAAKRAAPAPGAKPDGAAAAPSAAAVAAPPPAAPAPERQAAAPEPATVPAQQPARLSESAPPSRENKLATTPRPRSAPTSAIPVPGTQDAAPQEKRQSDAPGAQSMMAAPRSETAPQVAEPQPFPARDEAQADERALAAKPKTEAEAQAQARNAPQQPPASGAATGALAQQRAKAAAGDALVPSQGAAAAKASAEKAGAIDALAKQRGRWSIAEWIARLEKLRDDHRDADLAIELAAFRASHANADALLPPDLRAIAPAQR